MRWKTHLAFGFLSGLFALNHLRIGNKLLFFIFVLFGSLLPDVDHPESKLGRKVKIIGLIFRHRGIFHSIWAGAFLSAVLWFFVNKSCAIGLFIGYFSHLLIDGFTIQGINFLHPIGNLHLKGFIETGTVGEWVLFGIIVFLILAELGKAFSIL